VKHGFQFHWQIPSFFGLTHLTFVDRTSKIVRKVKEEKLGSRADVLPMKKAVAMAYFLAGKGKIKHAALVAVCAGFGLRIGDALSLRWSTVFTEGGKIKERVTLTERKTKQSRTLKVLPWVRKILVEYYEAARPSDHESPLFDFSRQRAWAIIRKTASDMGLQGKISPHSLRKAFCDFVYENTRDPVLTARITGHTNPAQLLRYIGRLPEVEERVWDRMAKQLQRS